MNLQDLNKLPARKLALLVKSGKIDPVRIAEYYLEKIEREDPAINSFVFVDRDNVLGQARCVRDRIKNTGDAGVLSGVPVAVKDNIATRGVPTTCCSKILTGYLPPYDATVIERIRRAGGLVLGKTNMDEFAMGSSNETSCFGPVRNPAAPDRVPGGSSGGSCAAVAAGFTPLALGSDTGGSIRQPAALCGVVGFKPTYGAVSRYGLIAFASSLDQVGPIARSVADVALLFSVIGGHDRFDSTSKRLDLSDTVDKLGKGVKGLKVGIPAEYYTDRLTAAVRKACNVAKMKLEEEGMTPVDLSLPTTGLALPAYHIVASAEASSNLARYDGVRYGYRGEEESTIRSMYTRTRSEAFGIEVKRRIMIGTFTLSAGYYDAYYLKAMKVRNLLLREFEDAFRRVDVILTPTTPDPAFSFGERLTSPVDMYRSDVFVTPASLAGLPAVSLPAGSVGGLPVGIQIIGNRWEDLTVLGVAKVLEECLM